MGRLPETARSCVEFKLGLGRAEARIDDTFPAGDFPFLTEHGRSVLREAAVRGEVGGEGVSFDLVVDATARQGNGGDRKKEAADVAYAAAHDAKNLLAAMGAFYQSRVVDDIPDMMWWMEVGG